MPLRIDQLETILAACGIDSKPIGPGELLIVSARTNSDALIRVKRTVLLRKVNGSLQVRCLRCGRRWTPLVKKPRQCPRCKSPYWNRPRWTARQAKRENG